MFLEILNPEGHPNRITVLKVMAILLNGWILPLGGAALETVWACSLRSRHVNNRPGVAGAILLQAHTLPDATPPLGKIPPFTKIGVTLKSMKRFRYPLRFRIS